MRTDVVIECLDGLWGHKRFLTFDTLFSVMAVYAIVMLCNFCLLICSSVDIIGMFENRLILNNSNPNLI